MGVNMDWQRNNAQLPPTVSSFGTNHIGTNHMLSSMPNAPRGTGRQIPSARVQQPGGSDLLGKLQVLQAQAEAKISRKRAGSGGKDTTSQPHQPSQPQQPLFQLTPLQKLQLKQQMEEQRKELEELQMRQQQGQHRHRQPPPPTQNTRFVSFEHGEEVNTALPPSYGPRRTTVGSVPNMTPSAQTMGGLSSWDAPAAKATAATAAPPPGLSSSWNLPPAQAPSTRTNTGLPSTSSLF